MFTPSLKQAQLVSFAKIKKRRTKHRARNKQVEANERKIYIFFLNKVNTNQKYKFGEDRLNNSFSIVSIIQKSSHHLTNTYSISLRKYERKKIARKVNEDFANIIHTFTFHFLFYCLLMIVRMLYALLVYRFEPRKLFIQTNITLCHISISSFSFLYILLNLNCSWAIFMLFLFLFFFAKLFKFE